MYRAFSLTWAASKQIYWNKKSVNIRKEFNSHRIDLEHQNGRSDVIWKRLIHGFIQSRFCRRRWPFNVVLNIEFADEISNDDSNESYWAVILTFPSEWKSKMWPFNWVTLLLSRSYWAVREQYLFPVVLFIICSRYCLWCCSGWNSKVLPSNSNKR